MRIRITRQQLAKLNTTGKMLGATSVRQIDRRTHEVVIHGTNKTLIVGV